MGSELCRVEQEEKASFLVIITAPDSREFDKLIACNSVQRAFKLKLTTFQMVSADTVDLALQETNINLTDIIFIIVSDKASKEQRQETNQYVEAHWENHTPALVDERSKFKMYKL
jgi:hypothetical protein